MSVIRRNNVKLDSLISDPGYKLTKRLIRLNIPIVPLPGATSVITSLVASGLPTNSFKFVGFFPE